MSEYREKQLNLLLQELIGEAIKKVDFGDVMITISRVETKEDLQYAKVFFTLYPDIEEKEILQVLDKNKRKISLALSQSSKRLRRVPRLRFKKQRMLAW